MVLETTLESPLDSKEIKPVNPKYSLERLMLKLKLQHFGHLVQRADSLEKTLMLGKIEGRRRRGYRGWDGWMASPIQWIWTWANSETWWRDREAWHAAVHEVSESDVAWRLNNRGRIKKYWDNQGFKNFISHTLFLRKLLEDVLYQDEGLKQEIGKLWVSGSCEPNERERTWGIQRGDLKMTAVQQV